MPVVNLKPYSILDAMKPDLKIGKLENGNDSLDTFFKQAIGKEPVPSFPKPADSPVQWIQLLQALDYQDLPGWPLLPPPKVDMQKCDKCSREFCSPINYRRHKRVHRRALNDKDFPKNREFLGVFWDKLSLEDAMEIVALGNISLQEVPGSSLVKALSSLIHKANFYSLPQAYVKAGCALLDVVQARPSRFPISSQELFSILDDASEKTFLCAGTAVSMAKFVVDGEPTKIVLELRNIVACTCFLLEQKLVDAWLSDKEAEALQCQKLLMEEEEAEQKRQAAILERKRLRKLRQKEQQKSKDQIEKEEDVSEENSSDLSSSPPSIETSTPPATPEEPPPSDLETNEEVDVLGLNEAAPSNADSSFQNVDNRIRKSNVHWPQIVSRRLISGSHRGAVNGYHSGLAQRQGVQFKNNRHKIWTRKTKPGNIAEELNVVVLEETNFQVLPDMRNDSGDQLLPDMRNDSGDQPVRNENREVLIGSIPVTLRESNSQCQSSTIIPDNQSHQNKIVHEKHEPNRSVKHWRPVGRHEGPNTSTVAESPDPSRLKLFCSSSAEAFLTQRWKEAIAADHVRLVPTPESESPNGTVVPEPVNPNILRSSENMLSNVGPVESGPDGAPKIKSKSKTGKGRRLRYIPKRKNVPNQVE
ncbi:hypothetical protein ACHQM5_000631 [Ranunculus cassubicifolius]